MPARFDPLSHPIIYQVPRVLSGASAWVEHFPFGWLLIEQMKPESIVELGAHFGDSYLAFCQAVSDLKLPTKCWAVDTWQGDKHSGPYGPHVLEWLRMHHDPSFSAFSTLLQMDFDTAQTKFADGQVDLLHIDGLHTYEAARHDFDSWLPRMSRRSVVMLHDTQVRTGDFGVWKVWEEVSKGRPNFEFEHGYGLGVVAVGPQVLPAVLEFLEFANSHPGEIRRCFSALGERMELLRRLTNMTNLILKQGSCIRPLADARGVKWMLPTTFEAAFMQLGPFTEAITSLVETITKENMHMAQRLQSLRPGQTP